MKRYHRVRPGETLETISVFYYGDSRYVAYIYNHNRHYIDNPNVLAIGQVILIPYLPIRNAIPEIIHEIVNG